MTAATHAALPKRILFISLLAAIGLLAAGCGSSSDSTEPTPQTVEPENGTDIASAPIDLDLPPAKAAATGLQHTCALHEGGSVSCWGDNLRGQLGNGVEPPDFEDPGFDLSEIRMGLVLPVAVKEIKDSTAIDAGYFHTCALLSNGRVAC